MNKLLVCFAALVVLSLPSAASADTVTTYRPSPVDLNDLDHHEVYTWRVDGVNLNGQVITGAKLKFKNIANWNGDRNRLFVHLLDTARYAGVRSFVDDPTNSSPVTDIRDDFVDPRYHDRSNWLVANGTADTFLFDREFTTTGIDFTYTFTSSQLQLLMGYINNGSGNFALGFDPDCHFFNDGISFEITTGNAPVPEPTTMVLLGTGLAGLYARRRRKQQQQS